MCANTAVPTAAVASIHGEKWRQHVDAKNIIFHWSLGTKTRWQRDQCIHSTGIDAKGGNLTIYGYHYHLRILQLPIIYSVISIIRTNGCMDNWKIWIFLTFHCIVFYDYIYNNMIYTTVTPIVAYIHTLFKEIIFMHI